VGVGAIIAIAVLLAFASLHEVMAARSDGAPGADRRPALADLPGSRLYGVLGLGLANRIRRAGLAGALSPRTVVLCKLGCSVAGALVGVAAAPGAPGRLTPLIAVAMPAAGFLGPDALLERWAARRRRRLLGSLPDALDLIGAGAASGRSIGTAFADSGGGGEGPLREELSATAAEISCGVPQRAALRSLRERVSGPEIAALCAAVDRSQELGSPLAAQLQRQSLDLRRSQRRAVEEQAARAAPKIQLVVALVLVPAVLLVIAAGLIANTDRLLGGLI
jgi:tight adherence protein C